MMGACIFTSDDGLRFAIIFLPLFEYVFGIYAVLKHCYTTTAPPALVSQVSNCMHVVDKALTAPKEMLICRLPACKDL